MASCTSPSSSSSSSSSSTSTSSSTAATTCFGSLPLEAVHHIFSYVPTCELATRCALVSRKWEEDIASPSLWRVLATRDFGLRVNPQASLLSHSRQLRWKEEYRGLMSRWHAIKELQLASDNIDANVVRLETIDSAAASCHTTATAARQESKVNDVYGQHDMDCEAGKQENQTQDDGSQNKKKRKLHTSQEGNEERRNAPTQHLLRALYLGNRNGADGGEGDNVGAVQANKPVIPFPTGNGQVAYFEVRIDSIGASGKDYPKRKAQPGWRQASYGWHGDDGRLYTPAMPIGRAWAGCPIWGPGDIVGCGLDFQTSEIFFTLNGQYLGVAFKDVQQPGSYYPTVGMNCRGAVITMNFGGDATRPFTYDLTSYPNIGAGFIGCVNTSADGEMETADSDEENDVAELKREISAMQMMLEVLAKRNEADPFELKSDMESIAYMMGYKKALQKSDLDLLKKCEYLERKCKDALLSMKFHLIMMMRDQRQQEGAGPIENMDALLNEVMMNLENVPDDINDEFELSEDELDSEYEEEDEEEEDEEEASEAEEEDDEEDKEVKS